MKKFLIIILISMPILGSAQVVIHDLTTGKSNSTGSLLSYGNVDDTWQVSQPGRDGFFKSAYVCSNLDGLWGINGCGRWITPKLDTNGVDPSIDNMVGKFQYVTRFNSTTPVACITWIKLNFTKIGGDNSISRIKFNGNTYLVDLPNYDDHNPLYENITVNLSVSDYIVGTNEIIVEVYNREMYSGFYACGNVTISNCP